MESCLLSTQYSTHIYEHWLHHPDCVSFALQTRTVCITPACGPLTRFYSPDHLVDIRKLIYAQYTRSITPFYRTVDSERVDHP